MYVCLCHQITEEKLEQTVRQSKSSKEVLKKLNLGESCGVCLLYAIEKIQTSVAAKENPNFNTFRRKPSV